MHGFRVRVREAGREGEGREDGKNNCCLGIIMVLFFSFF